MVDNKEKKRKKCGKVRWIAIFTLFAVLMIAGLSAKYILEHKKSAELTSSNFYFMSDYLKPDQTSYDMNDWSDGFDIQLFNYDIEDDKKVSDDEIKYSVSITGNWNYTDEHHGTLSPGTSDKKNKQTIHIQPGNTAQKGDEITVTVTTTAPYKKTISAKFTAISNNRPDYTIKDENDGSVSLEILSNDYKGAITVTWDKNQFDPDNTNQYMKNWNDEDQTGQITIEKNTTYHLLFFKNTTNMISTKTGSGTNITLPTT